MKMTKEQLIKAYEHLASEADKNRSHVGVEIFRVRVQALRAGEDIEFGETETAERLIRLSKRFRSIANRKADTAEILGRILFVSFLLGAALIVFTLLLCAK